MNNKVLVLAPHPDDELLIAGALIYTLHRKKYDITVAYYTNGDSVAEQGEIRIHEAMDSLKVLGIKEDKVIFLGYGNNWKNGKHIYNMADEEEAVSYAGKRETYCVKGHPEYCMLKFGKHHRYTRKNVKEDIKSVILDIKADIIVSVDFDSHCDHRALSLFFEEVMVEILKSDKDYKPIILKKFAYAGMNSGKWDYYNSPMLETQQGYKEELFDERFECDNPVFLWSDRIQLEVNWRTRTRHICNNILYKAALKHKSQKFHKRIGSFANADIVYWQRRTDSISYRANVSATSGKAYFVNDFKMIDCPNILCGTEGAGILQDCVWNPEITDSQKKLYFDFPAPVKISAIHLYENFLPQENILKAKLIFDTGKEIIIDHIDHKGRKTKIAFTSQHNVKHMEFQILEYQGTKFGLTELEIYEDDSEQPVPLKLYEKKQKVSKNIENTLDVVWDRKRHNIAPNHSKENDYYKMYHVLRKWNIVGNDSVVKWLCRRRYRNVAVYGMGDLGQKLNHDLESTKIHVQYAMDQYAGGMTANVPIVRADSFLEMPEVDIVIVTVISSYDAVKKDLMSQGCSSDKIISLQQIIDDMRYCSEEEK